MQSKPIYKYIFFGTAMRFLQDAYVGMLVKGEGYILENIDSFLDCLDEFSLPVTKRASQELKEFRKKMKKLRSTHRLNNTETEKLKKIMYELRIVLDAETEGNFAFIVTDKRIDVKKLLSNPSALMAPNIFKSLPKVAQQDFFEAGKCIAFELPTAAAFHLLRGTESVLREFYCSLVKNRRVKPLLWGNILKHLSERRKKPPQVLLNNLDNIKNSFRNPTNHPDMIYNIEEAQDLFGLCIEVVNRMISIIKQRR